MQEGHQWIWAHIYFMYCSDS